MDNFITKNIGVKIGFFFVFRDFMGTYSNMDKKCILLPIKIVFLVLQSIWYGLYTKQLPTYYYSYIAEST